MTLSVSCGSIAGSNLLLEQITVKNLEIVLVNTKKKVDFTIKSAQNGGLTLSLNFSTPVSTTQNLDRIKATLLEEL